MKNQAKFKPAVSNTALMLLAGFVWLGVGMMLLALGFSWLSRVTGLEYYLFSGAGVLLALLVHHFGFLRIVDKNLMRILQMEGPRCLFAFIPWKSYLLIVVMVTLGVVLRHSMIPRKELAIIYIGIGLALVLSSVRYLRVFFKAVTR